MELLLHAIIVLVLSVLVSEATTESVWVAAVAMQRRRRKDRLLFRALQVSLTPSRTDTSCTVAMALRVCKEGSDVKVKGKVREQRGRFPN